MTEVANTLVQGVLLGGLYALFAAGLSLSFGVMRLVNLAHGDFIIAAAYGALVLTEMAGVPLLPALLLLVPIFAALGYVGQRVMLNRVMGRDIMPGVLVTFGLSVMLQNLMLEGFSPNAQRISAGGIETAAMKIGGISIGVLPVLTFVAALAVLGGLALFLAHTQTGRLLRATSDDPEIVGLMGADRRHLFAVATFLSAATVALAGVLLAMRTNFDPLSGPVRLLFAFEAVIIGGTGSLWGTLAGGVILGLAQAVGATIDPGYQILAGHLMFLLLLFLRPQGLFPRQQP